MLPSRFLSIFLFFIISISQLISCGSSDESVSTPNEVNSDNLITALELEPNNDLMNTNQVTIGTSITGQLFQSNDEDWYQIDTIGSATIAVDVDVPTNSSGDYFRITAKDSSDNILASIGTGSDTSFVFSVTSAGSYYIIVSYGGGGYDSGQYVITPTIYSSSSMIVELEPNNDSLNTNQVTSGASITGQLFQSNDEDWYQIDTISSATVAVDVDVPTNSSGDYFRITAKDSSDNTLASIGTGSDTNFVFAVTSAGSYYIIVSYGGGGYDSGQYVITPTY